MDIKFQGEETALDQCWHQTCFTVIEANISHYLFMLFKARTLLHSARNTSSQCTEFHEKIQSISELGTVPLTRNRNLFKLLTHLLVRKLRARAASRISSLASDRGLRCGLWPPIEDIRRAWSLHSTDSDRQATLKLYILPPSPLLSVILASLSTMLLFTLSYLVNIRHLIICVCCQLSLRVCDPVDFCICPFHTFFKREAVLRLANHETQQSFP